MTVQLLPGSWQARWAYCYSGVLSNVGFINLPVDVYSTVDCVQGCSLYGIPLTANHRRLRLQLTHEHRAWQANWQQVFFHVNHASICGNHDSRIRVRRHASEHCPLQSALSNDIVTKHQELWFGERFRITEDPICYELRDNLNSNRYAREVLTAQSRSPSFKASSQELSFSRIMHAHMLQRLFETSVQPNTCNSFSLGLLIRRDMSPTELVWNLVGRHLARDLRSITSSKDELLLHIQAIWTSLPQADIHSRLFDSISRRIVTLITARGG
ncbi:transposable element Tcb1 transposase [Trichonephila clavipes]|nr:transposable element Tcb1 transposase [Trichonephila clavipes]